MKEIVANNNKRTVSIDEFIFDDSKYYGVSVNGAKGFITQDKYLTGMFLVLSIHALTRANCYEFRSQTGRGLIEQILTEDQDCKVFEFNSFKELSDWLNKTN